MKVFTLKKRLMGDSRSINSSFKSFIMLLVMMLMTASHVSAKVYFETIDGLRYLLDSEAMTAALMPNTEKYSGDIVVPEKVIGNDGREYSVTSLGDRCFYECRITSITIPSSVTTLGDYCFSNCSGLTSITIPSSVTSLGERCFGGCDNLTTITIPSSVTSLGAECFYNCSSLTSITIPSSITSLGDGCFSCCSGLTSITIPSSVTSLGDYCFVGCSGLTSVTIPSSVTSLGDGCFSYCSDLTSITIPSSVTSLGDGCFSCCSGLTSITIPSSITSLGDDCFTYCDSLTSITIPSSVASLGDYCFSGCIGLTSITIPLSVTSLGNYCFQNCTGLTSIIIPSSVTSLGTGCFDGCEYLETIYFKGKPAKTSSSSYSGLCISTNCIIKVPAEYLEDYKAAFGSNYKYIYAWNPDESGDDKPVTQCATPSVAYEAGKLRFNSETPGAEYHYTISDTDMANEVYNKEGEVSLSGAYKISVYATADGYAPSEKTEATLYWINANLEKTNINLAQTRGIMASAHDGIVSISGLNDGEVVMFYAADGRFVGSSSAVAGIASCAVSEELIIAKIGNDAIKIAVR